jgi:L,D-peptidoglycan transpeptidase YkuD (ErfK/YbiS/YcfS/YnhG family)
MRRIAFGTILIAASAALLPAHEAEAKYCPRVLYRATRLVVVSVPNMQSTAASVRTFERASPAARWESRSEREPAVVGAQGIAWGNPYVSYAKKDELLKREGDERTPAGVYRFGATFGFAANKLPGHLLLQPAKQFCVHDVSSRYYGQIVDKRVAGEKTSGENMAKFPLYKRGIVIDYPARPQSKAGSCIFLHIWGGEGVGTAGCVALPEERVAYLQEWAGSRNTAIAIVSEDTVDRFKGCLPVSSAVSRAEAPVTVPLPARKDAAKGANGTRAALAP